MSELQLGLLGIGVAAVFVVLAYNKWQEMRYKRQAERDFGSPHDDVLLRPANLDGRGAPSDAVSRGAIVQLEDNRIEPVFAPESPLAQERDAGAAAEQHMLTDAYYFIVSIERDDDLEASAVIQAASAALANPSKTVRWEGFSEHLGAWESLRADGRYTNFRAGMQLVDRSGPATDQDLAQFDAAVQQVALALPAVPLAANRAAAAAQALELDRFCGEVDIQIVLNIVPKPGATFSAQKVKALAQTAGLKRELDGRLRRRESGDELFALSVRDGAPLPDTANVQISGLTLELDVPRAPGGLETFEEFRSCAIKLAAKLDATIADDNGTQLSPVAFDGIAARIAAVHRVMEDRGIRAGGPAALKLFA